MIDRAKEILLQYGSLSVPLLQRKLKVSAEEAKRIMKEIANV